MNLRGLIPVIIIYAAVMTLFGIKNNQLTYYEQRVAESGMTPAEFHHTQRQMIAEAQVELAANWSLYRGAAIESTNPRLALVGSLHDVAIHSNNPNKVAWLYVDPEGEDTPPIRMSVGSFVNNLRFIEEW